MPEAPKNTNETAERRKRIFALFKKFHPDKFVSESEEIKKASEEISKVLTGILSLDANEPIPGDLRAEALRIVFIDDEGILVGSTKKLTVDISQEKFISDLEYILQNKSFPETTKDAQYNSNNNVDSGTFNSLIRKITTIEGPLVAVRVLKQIKEQMDKFPHFYQDGLSLIKTLQEKMSNIVERKIDEVIGNLTALGLQKAIKQWEEEEILSTESAIFLQNKLQVKFMQIMENEVAKLSGPLTAAGITRRCDEYLEKQLLTSQQVAILFKQIKDKLTKL